eukprot:s3614_g7.t3
MVLNQRGGRRHLKDVQESLWSHFSLRAKPSFGKGVASQPRSGPAPPSAGSAPEGGTYFGTSERRSWFILNQSRDWPWCHSSATKC